MADESSVAIDIPEAGSSDGKKKEKKSDRKEKRKAKDDKRKSKRSKKDEEEDEQRIAEPEESSASDGETSEEEEEEEAKVQKQKKPIASSSADDGKDSWDIDSKKKAAVNEFKGHILVDLREWYQEKGSGQQKPGKGVSLTITQWEAVKKLIPKIDAAVARKQKK